MSKRSILVAEILYCGIDVSARSLTVVIQRQGQPAGQGSFTNDLTGHRALIAWLQKPKSPVRVSLEATGVYSLDLAVALDNAGEIEVAVLNPKVANRFAQTIRRSKTDAADAEVLAKCSRRMPFTSWVAPSSGSIRLRSLVRYIESLSTQSAQNQNRLHAAQGSAVTLGCVIQNLKRAVTSLEQRIRKLRREAMMLVRKDELLISDINCWSASQASHR